MTTNIDKILKDYKDLGITRASDAIKYTLFQTPFATVNNLIGGLPRGRYTTLAGPEHVGKGAFCAQVIAYLQSQDENFIALWTDAENSFDEAWASKLGVDLDRLLIQRYNAEVNTMEKLLDKSLDLLRSLNVSMWVIDSIGALVPKSDIFKTQGSNLVDKSLESTNMLNLQRKLGEFYRKANIIISPRAKDSYEGCAVILLGQIYAIPNDVGADLQAVKGGNAVKHWAHLRLLMRRGPRSDWPEPINLKGHDGVVRKYFPGWSGRIKVDKTRINSNESKEILLPFTHGKGFDSRVSTINSAFGLGLIERSGAIYSNQYLPEGKMKGKDNVIKFFTTNDEAYKNLHESVMSVVIQDVPESEVIKTETNELNNE